MEKLCSNYHYSEMSFWIYYLLFRFDLHLKLTLQKEYKSKTHYLLIQCSHLSQNLSNSFIQQKSMEFINKCWFTILVPQCSMQELENAKKEKLKISFLACFSSSIFDKSVSIITACF